MTIRARLVIAWVGACALAAARLSGQGETTSAIVGTVTDPSGGAVAGAGVTIANTETGWKRSTVTDDAGRLSLLQLQPGSYTIRIEAAGFEPQTSGAVLAGLGQRQTVNFSLRLAAAKGEVSVTGEVPLINPDNPNTATTLSAPALESLPNPGGDMTYPLQFAPGALINTAGSGNDFIQGPQCRRHLWR